MSHGGCVDRLDGTNGRKPLNRGRRKGPESGNRRRLSCQSTTVGRLGEGDPKPPVARPIDFRFAEPLVVRRFRLDGRSITSAAATATAAAVSATTTTAAITTALGRRNARLGFVDGEPPAFVLFLVQALDRRRGLGVRIHLDKAETLAAACVAV